MTPAIGTLDGISDKDLDRIEGKAYGEAFRRWLIRPTADEARDLRLIPAQGLGREEARAMGVSAGTAGGYLAPVEFSKKIWSAMTASSAMRSVSTIVPAVGIDAGFPYVDDTGNSGRILAEGQTWTETDPVVGLRQIPNFMFSSDAVRVSFQLLQDADPLQFEEFLVNALAERVARLVNSTMTTGAGANMPLGIVTAAAVGVSGGTGQTTTVTWDDLIDLAGSVGSAYAWGADGQRNIGRYMMSGATLKFVRKLKDAGGTPLWQTDPAGQTPGTIAGHRLIVNDDMPSLAANAKPILFGDFKKGYVIRDGAVVVSTLTERFADQLQVAYHVASRHGGGLVDTAAVRAYLNSAT